MTSINGKELMRGDAVIFQVEDQVMVGNIQQFNDRGNVVRISSYPLYVPANKIVLAKDALEAFIAANKPTVAPDAQPQQPVTPPEASEGVQQEPVSTVPSAAAQGTAQA
jgi:hypothetical protein